MSQPWTDAEKDIVRQRFPDGGAEACREYLTGRTLASISTMATRLRATAPRRADPHWEPHKVELTDKDGQIFGLSDWVEAQADFGLLEVEVVEVFKNGRIRIDFHDEWNRPRNVDPATVSLSRRSS